MSEQRPPNPPAEREVELGAFLTSIRDALEKRTTVVKNSESLIKIDDERKTLELEQSRIEVRELEKKYSEEHDLHDTRKQYARRLFWLIVGWLSVVVVFVALAGFNAAGFSLSNTVLVAFITSTTVSVLGLFILAAKWLFPSSRDGH